ncbi:hypothetical protein EXE46_10040 [Halorubrum sp. GN11_10-6_MGM]|uniref:hypothetical protein n=1 Tax=Halorubrum sp. GN11_10-6_MGM TaxID=2518112 RepID=UPI0010FA3388|nr:hypothetical protein [Halorubrum sp. GN11_10-6_MGM]TKX74304.1 hypothetical protein EXE46_10040 [Halorubrum sp. GN11_10-6_MGM]
MADPPSPTLGALRPRRAHDLPFLVAAYVLGCGGVLALDPWPWVVKALFFAALPLLAYAAAAGFVALAPDRVPTPSRSRAVKTAALAGVTAIGFTVWLTDALSIAVVGLPAAAVLAWPMAAAVYLGVMVAWSGSSPLIAIALFALGAAGTAVWQYWLVGWSSRRIAAIRASRR